MTNEPIVNLDNCAREPIHIPGAIQPHGVLFVLSEPELSIVQVSENSSIFLGLSPAELLDQGLDSFLNPEQIGRVRFALSSTDSNDNNPVKLRLPSKTGDVQLDAMVHRHDGFSFLELEPSTPANDTYFLDFFKTVSKVTNRLQTAGGLVDLLTTAAAGFRQITGFDRVMIYRFSDSGAGEVIAESKIEEAEPYLGLWYPASDIPEQARRMYVLSPIRSIPDVSYKPVLITPVINPVSRRPSDLSHASLRSVSPIHCEYLTNMGVTASMSVSLIRDGRLWGLIACHHFSPKFVPYESRKASTFLGQVLSGEIVRRESEAEATYSVHSNSIQAQFLELMAGAANPLEGLVQFSPNLLDLMPAGGAAVVTGDEITMHGVTPDEEGVREIVSFMTSAGAPSTFATGSLKNHFAAAQDLAETAAGVIVLTISQSPPSFVLLFRPQIAQTVVWAGDPNKPAFAKEDSFRLSPRKSFEAWKEEVQATALPWSVGEVRAANELRKLISVVAFKK